MKVIGTTRGSERLGVSSNRVRALIESGRFKAQKIGREYAINPSALKAVQNRKSGPTEQKHEATMRLIQSIEVR